MILCGIFAVDENENKNDFNESKEWMLQITLQITYLIIKVNN